MSGSDVEKGAGVSSPQQPRATLSHPHDGFLPTYQEHLNAELRNFPQAAPQANLQPFDRIQEPTSKSKLFLRRRAWWSAISILLFVTVSAFIGSAVYLYRSTHLKDDGVKVSPPISSFQTITISKLTSTKHAPQTSIPIPARSATTITVFPTTVVVNIPANSTVFITVTASAPRIFTSTTIRFITVFPSTASTTSQYSASSTEEASAITFSTETTSPPSTITTASSTQALSSTETSTASPSTIATTLVSIITATATPTTSSTPPPATRSGRLGFCGVPGEACA